MQPREILIFHAPTSPPPPFSLARPPVFLKVAHGEHDFGGLSAYLAGPVGIRAEEVEQLRTLLLTS